MTDNPTEKEWFLQAELDLRRLYVRFMEKALRDFPHLEGSFLLHDRRSGKTFGGFDDEQDEATALREMAYPSIPPRKFLNPDFTRAAAFRPASRFAFPRRGILVDWFSRETRVISRASDPFEKEIIGILEHELGHVAAPGGSGYRGIPDTLFKENVADTFALIRMFQQDAASARLIEANIWSRSARLIFDNRHDHYTARAVHTLQKIINSHPEVLLSATPTETGKIALRLATHYGHAGRATAAIAQAFSSVRDLFAAGKVTEAIATCAEITLQPHEHLEKSMFTAGYDFLMPLLTGKMEITSTQFDIDYLRSEDFQSGQWQEVRAALERRHAALTENPVPAYSPAALMSAYAGDVATLAATGALDPSPEATKDLATYTDWGTKDLVKASAYIFVLARATQEGKAPSAAEASSLAIYEYPYNLAFVQDAASEILARGQEFTGLDIFKLAEITVKTLREKKEVHALAAKAGQAQEAPAP